MPEADAEYRSLPGPESLLGRPWRLKALDNASSDANHLGRRFLRTRGLSDPSEIDAWLNYSLQNMSDPALMPDATIAARRIIDGIARGESITVYGDYDVDGVTSSALLHLALRSMFDFELKVYIPHRLKEGYGLNGEAIRTALPIQTVSNSFCGHSKF